MPALLDCETCWGEHRRMWKHLCGARHTARTLYAVFSFDFPLSSFLLVLWSVRNLVWFGKPRSPLGVCYQVSIQSQSIEVRAAHWQAESTKQQARWTHGQTAGAWPSLSPSCPSAPSLLR